MLMKDEVDFMNAIARWLDNQQPCPDTALHGLCTLISYYLFLKTNGDKRHLKPLLKEVEKHIIHEYETVEKTYAR